VGVTLWLSKNTLTNIELRRDDLHGGVRINLLMNSQGQKASRGNKNKKKMCPLRQK